MLKYKLLSKYINVITSVNYTDLTNEEKMQKYDISYKFYWTRLHDLENNGYVKSRQSGRKKEYSYTAKGRKLFNICVRLLAEIE